MGAGNLFAQAGFDVLESKPYITSGRQTTS